MQNVQSTVTSSVTPKLNGKANRATRRAAASNKVTAGTVGITKEEAVKAAFEYGQSMAGLDGTLVRAIVAFRTNESVLSEMLTALNVGYVMRKLGVATAEAEHIVGLLKYNEKKDDDKHRTFEQERIMIAVRVLWSRAKKMAGVPKAEAQAKAEATRAAKEAEREAHESRLIAADEIVNPKDDVDPFEALVRVASTLKALQNKYAAKLTGDRGSAWRAWIAKAPK